MKRRVLHYLVAAGLAVAATALNVALNAPLKGPTLLFPVTAATLAGLYGGVGAGFFSGVLSLAFHAFFVLEPRYSFNVAERSDWYRLVLLAVAASLMAAVAGSFRSAVLRAKAEKARAQQSADSLALSHALVTALASAHTQEEVTKAIFERGFAALGARTMLVARRVEPDHLNIVRAFGFPGLAASTWGRFPITTPVPYAEAVRLGKSVWIESRQELERRYPATMEIAGATDARAWACVPIASEGRIVGSFCIGFAQARRFGETDKRFLESLAATCGEALERTRLFEAERAARLRAEAAEGEARHVGGLQERLVAVVSHDLRSPLAAIAMGVDLLLKSDQLAEHQVSKLTRIRNSATRMERLIRDLLDFTRARRMFEMPISPEPASMEEIVRRAVLEIRVSNPGRDIRLDVQGDQSGNWDPARMEQAVSNLVSNAIQHGYSSSPVWVRTRGTTAKLVIEVENEGRSIPAEKLPVLFEPFQGGQAGRSDHLGLGLFIVREIVRAHGGTIAASSTPVGITTFTVELPRLQPGLRSSTSVTGTPTFEPPDPRRASSGESSESAR
jgi:K+-sensing histidine kinase KdpD